MKLTDRISLVASGDNGLCLTHPLDCNVYLVDTKQGLILIDAGSGENPEHLELEMEKDGYCAKDIRKIVITHAHADHAAGAMYFAEISGAEMISSAYEANILAQQELLDRTMKEYIKAGFYPENFKFHAINDISSINDSESIVLGDISLRALVIPGHTAGSLCLYGKIEGRNVLFSGDVVFFGGKINLISIFDVDLLAYKDGILRLENLPVDILLPGHLQPVMRRGALAIRNAAEIFRRFGVPASIV